MSDPENSPNKDRSHDYNAWAAQKQANEMQVRQTTPPVHVHKFVIPVEWKNVDFQPHYDGNGHVTIQPSILSAIKLRCECGEKTERG